MKFTTFFIAFLTLGTNSLFSKEKLPAMILGITGDTVSGEIKVKNNFDEGKNQAYAYLQFSIEFTSKEGKTQEILPGKIKGFLVWTSDSTFVKYVSASLTPADSLNEEETKFRRPGMAARFDVTENQAFVRVLDETGDAKLFVFYEEDVLTYSQGGMPPTMYNSLNERFLVSKKGNAFIKLNSKSKRRKAQLLQLFNECEKIKGVLAKPKLDTNDEKILQAIITSYNSNCAKSAR